MLLHSLMLVLALGAIGGLLLRRKRKARWFDPLIWCAWGIGLSLFFASMVNYRREFAPFIVGTMLFIWAVVLSGIILNVVLLKRQKEGTAIAESIGCLTVLLVLIAFLLPGVPNAREAARQMTCLNNMRNVGLSLHNYVTVNGGSLPRQRFGDPPQSWRIDVLPYLDQAGLYDRFDRSVTWNSEKNQPYSKISIKVFFCPDMKETNEQGYPLTAFSVPQYPNGIYSPGEVPKKLSEIPDGTSRTLLLVEACEENIPWAEPRDVDASVNPVGVNLKDRSGRTTRSILTSKHPSAANVIYADGSGGQLSNNISPEVLRQLLDATDGKPDSRSGF